MTIPQADRDAMLELLTANPGVTLMAIKARTGWSLGRCSRIRASVAAEAGLAISTGGYKGDLRKAAERLLAERPDLSSAALGRVLGCDSMKASQLRRDAMLRQRINDGEPVKLSHQAVGFTAMVETARDRARKLVDTGTPLDTALRQVNAEYPEARLNAAQMGGGGVTAVLLLRDLMTALHGVRFDLADEVRAHGEIEEQLCGLSGVTVAREVWIGPDSRIDLTATRGITVGIEVKRRCAPGKIRDQLDRYAACDGVAGLLLLSSTAVSLPETMHGKPVRAFSLGRAFL